MEASKSNAKNPFLDEDEDEEFLNFGNKWRYDSSGTTADSNQRVDPEVQRMQQLYAEADASEQRTMDSTKRALASIYESERMGIATAEELMHQGEQLDNVERKTQEINQMTKTSQQHLNSIKSVFGGIKGWFKGEKKKEPVTPTHPTVGDRSANLQATMAKSECAQMSAPHPTVNLWEEDDALSGPGYASAGRGMASDRQTFKGVAAERNGRIDDNLELMGDGLSRLKNLGLGLQDEIEVQNKQVDRIIVGVDRADITVGHQNRQMAKILK